MLLLWQRQAPRGRGARQQLARTPIASYFGQTIAGAKKKSGYGVEVTRPSPITSLYLLG